MIKANYSFTEERGTNSTRTTSKNQSTMPKLHIWKSHKHMVMNHHSVWPTEIP